MAADRTNVVIKATDVTGKQVSTTINYANPNAANITLKTMGQMMNALTTNEYIQTNRTDITVLDTAPPTPADKQTPTFTASGTTFSAALAGNFDSDPSTAAGPNGGIDSLGTWYKDVTFTYNGDGEISATTTSDFSAVLKEHTDNSYLVRFIVAHARQAGILPKTITASTNETATYKAATITLNFNA